MAVYYINLLLILALAFPLCICKPSVTKKAVYLLITFGWMWFIATFRYNIGWDYYDYIDIFEQIRVLNSLWDVRYEPGFVLLTRAMTLFIHNHVVMYGVYQIIILLPVMWFIYRYCKDIWLATWLYATLTFFYISMNFTRQALACSIALLGYKFLRERKPIPYILIVLLAASFHFAVLIMIPVYFVCHLRLTKKLAIFYGAAAFVLYIASSLIMYIAIRYFLPGYEGTPMLEPLSLRHMLVPISILATCLILLPRWKKCDPDAVMLTNMMMFSAIIWLLATRYMIIQRFVMSLEILLLAALPAAISVLRASDEDHATLETLRAAQSAPKNKNKKSPNSKETEIKIEKLAETIKEREVYYWSAVAAVLIVTLMYHALGVNIGFHNVFPYQSVLNWAWL